MKKRRKDEGKGSFGRDEISQKRERVIFITLCDVAIYWNGKDEEKMINGLKSEGIMGCDYARQRRGGRKVGSRAHSWLGPSGRSRGEDQLDRGSQKNLLTVCVFIG